MKKAIIEIKQYDGWRNTAIQKKTGIRDCRYVSKKLKMSLAGHIARRELGKEDHGVDSQWKGKEESADQPSDGRTK